MKTESVSEWWWWIKVKEIGKGKRMLLFFYNFWALALFGFELRFWKSFIRSSVCTLEAGSHELSLVGYPFHLIR